MSLLFQQPTEYFDMGIFLAFFVVVSLVCLILLVKIKLKQRRSQVMAPERPLTFLPEAPLPVQTRAGSCPDTAASSLLAQSQQRWRKARAELRALSCFCSKKAGPLNTRVKRWCCFQPQVFPKKCLNVNMEPESLAPQI